MKEEWKDITGYKGYYQISNIGRVKSLSRIAVNFVGPFVSRNLKGKMLKIGKNNYGYSHVALHKEGKKKVHQVHRLVANAFIPNPNNKPQVNHIDFDTENSIVDNLEWVTVSENHLHSIKNGRKNYKWLLKSVVLMDMEENELLIFDSIQDASMQCGCNRDCIGKVCNGKKPSVNKLKFKFL